MDKNSIVNSLQKWEDIRHNSPELVSYLSQGNCFSFTNNQYQDTSKYMHAYLGINEGKLKMFVIPSAYDNENTADIAKYVEICDVFSDPTPLVNPLNSDNIPAATAIKRVDRWDKDYAEWVPKKIVTPDGIFKAFAIPTQDFVTPEVKVHFALQDEVGQPMGYNADMVVACKEEKTIYEDYATPVPPYSPSIVKASFYLLSQV